MQATDLNRELEQLTRSYHRTLETLQDKARTALAKPTVSSHDPFNMSATCQELATLAGKIEQTVNVIRWMGEAK